MKWMIEYPVPLLCVIGDTELMRDKSMRSDGTQKKEITPQLRIKRLQSIREAADRQKKKNQMK
ncbi:MAG: hypothetical protein RRA35_13455 [Desulfomonilia bacterium]|nr:hypothetical protein [Desulfomonilia bacterium]